MKPGFSDVIPLKNVDVGVYRDVKVYPGGMSFGVKLTTEGVLIVGMSDVNGADGAVNPAYNAGIRSAIPSRQLKARK